MYIQREIKQDIKSKLLREKAKIIIIYGARQVGKTSLTEHILKDLNKKILRLNGDEAQTAIAFSSRSREKLQNISSGYDIVFIDEAQRIENIGLNLKILHDSQPHLKIIVTGSSSFDLASSIQESLTGRAWVYHLSPLAICELKNHFPPYELSQNLAKLLIFGSYPELFSLKNISEKQDYLHTLAENYLYKDILAIEGIKGSQKIRKLLQLLAFQVGSEVSLTELSQQMEIHKKTVERYIHLLEKFFVIFPLTGFRRNLRKELTQKPKIYFCDMGIRNALINNFNDLENRNDVGILWENFIIAERLKFNSYHKRFVSSYFWRTYTGAELDYVEEYGGQLNGYEIKWMKKASAPRTWKESYKASFKYINQDNFLSFISGKKGKGRKSKSSEKSKKV